jgi:hypothetical protein
MKQLLLIRHQGDYKEPYDWDDYAQVYFPKAEELVSEAQKAEQEGNKDKASELYLWVRDVKNRKSDADTVQAS